LRGFHLAVVERRDHGRGEDGGGDFRFGQSGYHFDPFGGRWWRGLSLRAMARSKVVTEITTWASPLPAIG